MKISVIMGVYNGEKGLRKSIESILAQTFSDFEFIICNDASTDSSLKILKEYEKKDKRVKILENDVNSGLSRALNKCLKYSTGKYIARMDDDDVAHSERFEIQYNFLEQNLMYSIVGTSLNLVDENGIWGKRVIEGERTIDDIIKGKSFAHPTTMMRRDALVQIGGYNESSVAERTEDYDLWCKLYFHGYKGLNLSDILLDYQESKESMKVRKYKYRINSYRLRKYWTKKFNFPFYYQIYAIRPLVAGLIPNSLMKKYKIYVNSRQQYDEETIN